MTEEIDINTDTEDKRPDPKPRRNAALWQTYLIWRELVEMRKRHVLRIASIEAGKSNFDATLERDFLESLDMDDRIDYTKEAMVECGEDVGPVWDWITSIKGLGAGSLAAQLLAQVDDIGKFATVSKLWRHAGYGLFDYWVDEQGKVMCPQRGWKWVTRKGEKVKEWTVPVPKDNWKLERMRDRGVEKWLLPFSKRLKSTCWLVAKQFIRQHSPTYDYIYLAEQERLRKLYPAKIKVNGKTRYNDSHIRNMALRKMTKIFLQHLWVKWREYDGLPVSEPYVKAIMGHTNIIQP